VVRVAANLIKLALAAVAISLVVGQCRKPRWWTGRLVIWLMNRSHAGLTEWGLGHAVIARDASILDVGCGGGRAIRTLAAATHGRVCGVDYSATSVAAARRANADAIAAGRVEIVQGSVSRLPFPDASFDLVTAVETHYYWPDFVADLRELRRVLKPDGRVVIVAEAYRRPGGLNAIEGLAMRLVGGRHLTVEEHRNALARAGFTDVAVDEERRKGWICASGRQAGQRPSPEELAV
jgi:SAM-dependent methyltransferase